MTRIGVLLILSTCCISSSLGQLADFTIKTTGYPYIRHYENDEYGYANQNWEIEQDSLGIIYFANQSGLVYYDGSNWVNADTKNNEAIRCLAKDEAGQLYYGGVYDFGYITSDVEGSITPISLTDKLDSNTPISELVYSCLSTTSKVFFQASNGVYLYDKITDTIDFHPISGLYQATVIKNQWFARCSDGIVTCSNEKFLIIKNSKRFANSAKTILTNYRDQLLIYNPMVGCFTWNGQMLHEEDWAFTLGEGEAINFITPSENYLTAHLKNSGIVVFDLYGNQVLKMNKTTGLASDICYDLFIDRAHNLWIGHDNGISRLDWTRAFSNIDNRHNLSASSTLVHSIGDSLFVTSFDGVHLGDLSKQQPLFSEIGESGKTYWMITSDSNSIIALRGDGADQLNGGTLSNIYDGLGTAYGIDFTEDGKHILISTTTYFYVLEKNQSGDWKLLNRIENFKSRSDFLINSGGDEFWMTNSGSGVYKLKLSPNYDSLEHTLYGQEHGLPSNFDNRVFRYGDGVIFATDSGVYLYDKEQGIFKAEPIISNALEFGSVFRFAQATNGDIWFLYNKNGQNLKGVLRKKNGVYTKELLPMEKTNKHNWEHLNTLNDTTVLVCSRLGLLHIDPRLSLLDNSNYSALINSVEFVNGSKNIANLMSPNSGYVIPFDSNSIAFNFSAATYDRSDKTEFQYRLIGYENNWSSWTKSTKKEYTNLPSGELEFQVRAINIYRTVSHTASFKFNIKPPWYLTWWMVVAYAIISVLFIYLIVKWNTRRLAKENSKLEATIKKRIADIEVQRNQAIQAKQTIESQAKSLEASLREKEILMKEIHHRVKNNLQVISSILNLQANSLKNDEAKAAITQGQMRIKTMALLHQKLYQTEDLEELNAREYITQLATYLSGVFRPIDSKIKIEYDLEAVMLSVDIAVPMGLILNELLTNSLKYAFPEKKSGLIKIVFNQTEKELILNIQDNGIGLKKINLKESTTLGFKLVKLLSRQLNATIKVNSTTGLGVKISIPKGR